MSLDVLLSTILLVSFLVTIVLAIGSYAAYKMRESRRAGPEAPLAGTSAAYFERVVNLDEPEPTTDASRADR